VPATQRGVGPVRHPCVRSTGHPDCWPGSSSQVTAFVALIVAWSLLAIAAIVTASTRRFEHACIHFVTAGVAVGFAIITAIVLALIALGAAFVAVQPVWRQVTEMRKQSAIQTFEYLRSRAIAIEQERALATRADNTIQLLRSIDEQEGLQDYEDALREMEAAVEALKASFEHAGFERWGSLDAVRSRG
jgi:MFS superfamily sulfate permease-like transporter